jgi:hypothetical protein
VGNFPSFDCHWLLSQSEFGKEEHLKDLCEQQIENISGQSSSIARLNNVMK